MRRLRLLPLLCILGSPHPSTAQIATPGGVALSPFPVLEAPSSFPTFGMPGGSIWSVFLGAHPGSALHAQHIHDDGSFAPTFSAPGRALTLPSTDVNGISAASDGNDGAVITWFGVSPKDSNSTYIALRYLHVLDDGTYPAAFRDTGLVVSTLASAAVVISDGLGGAYVVWEELKGTSNPDIYAQHYDYWGEAMWTPSGSPTGVPVCAVVGIQRLRAIHSDGAGGAYVVWADMRAPNTAPLYVAHLGNDGVSGSPWVANGVRVTALTAGIRIVGSAPSPAGGLWLAWRDLAVSNQVLGQHIAPNGAFRWVASGALLATVSPSRGEFAPGPSGHAFFTWGGDTDIRCSRLDSTGVRVWSTEPTGRVMVTPATGAQVVHTASDGINGQWVAWSVDNAGQRDVRALRFDASAAPWPDQPAQGEVFAGTVLNEDPVAWFVPPSGPPSLAWLEAGQLRIRRLPTNNLGVEGTFGSAGLALGVPWPHPLRGPDFTLRFAAPPGEARVELFDTAGRRLADLTLRSAGGAQSVRWDEAAALPPGVYALRLTSAGRVASRRIVRVR